MIEARPLPLLARSTIYIVAALIVSAIVWASVSQVDRIVVGHGKLITVDPLMVVQPLEIGVVRSIRVSVGQVVKAGEALATLDPTFTESKQSADQAKLDSLIAESQRLKAEISGQPFPPPNSPLDEANLSLQASIYANRQAEYRATIASDEADIAKLEAQLVTNEAAQAGMKDRIDLLEHIQLIRSELWDKHLGTLLNLEQSRLDRLALADQLAERINQHRELLEQIASARQQKEKYASNWKREAGERLTDILRQAAETRQQLTIAERRSNLVTLRAPADGVILEIAQRSIGSVIKEAETLFTLVPLNSKYEAEVDIESADIARLRVGDDVRLKLEALPFQRYGTLSGRLRTITEGAFQNDKDQNQAQATKSDSGPSFFRARITLGSMTLHNLPEDFRLVPGMVTSAEIVVGKRSVISYVMYPIFRVFNESLREP
jgi:HlyD family secretion protein